MYLFSYDISLERYRLRVEVTLCGRFLVNMQSIDTVLVSSVLNKDVKQFGKKNMFDDCDDTCWNSDQGSPQWVKIKLKEEIQITSFYIQFQGGFVGKNCLFRGELNDQNEEISFFPEDNNSIQKFDLKHPTRLKTMSFIFNSSSDFFGRIPMNETPKALGFDRNLEPVRIIGGTTNEAGELLFLMAWRGTEEADLVSATEANMKAPQVVIDFYAKRLTFNVAVNVELLRPHGFLGNREPEKILEAINAGRQLMFVMKWKDTDEVGLVSAKDAYERCPQIAIKFFEGRLHWKGD